MYWRKEKQILYISNKVASDLSEKIQVKTKRKNKYYSLYLKLSVLIEASFMKNTNFTATNDLVYSRIWYDSYVPKKKQDT